MPSYKGIVSLALARSDYEARVKAEVARRRKAKDKILNTYSGTLGGQSMKMVKVQSNYARNRTVTFPGYHADLVVTFDQYGYAMVPEHQLPLVKEEMRRRPGRYKILAEADAAKDSDDGDSESPEDVLKEQVSKMLDALESEDDEDPAEPEEGLDDQDKDESELEEE